MEPENLFLVFAALLFFLDLAMLFREEEKWHKQGFYVSLMANILVIATYFMFLQAFLINDFQLEEVYMHSSSDLSLLFKLSATWAGMGGSMLFLASLLSIIYLVLRLFGDGENDFLRQTFKFLDFTLLFFLFTVLGENPFKRLSEAPMNGQGLNPLLQNPWMAIHPPVVFLGYTFIIVTFAFTMSNLGLNVGVHPEEKERRDFFVKLSWLFITLGISIGGLWSYEVLGWGGYWAWDPVETASLLPWLTLTAYFHLQSSKKRRSAAKELIILLTFSLTIFTTLLTRGGLLESVHAFGASATAPILIILIFSMVSVFLYLTRKKQKDLFQFTLNKKSVLSISLFIAFCSLIALTIVCFLGILVPIGESMFMGFEARADPSYFNNWCFPFTLLFIAAMIGCSMPSSFTFRRYGVLMLLASLTSAFTAITGFPTGNLKANIGLPFLALALITIGFKIGSEAAKKRKSIHLFGRTLVHLGIILILLGVFISSTSEVTIENISLRINEDVDLQILKIRLENIAVNLSKQSVCLLKGCYPEYSCLRADLAIEDGNKIFNSGKLWIYLYSSYGVISRPLIISDWVKDIYLSVKLTSEVQTALTHVFYGEAIKPTEISINVKVIPSIRLIWLGVAVLTLGITPSIIKSMVILKKRKTTCR